MTRTPDQPERRKAQCSIMSTYENPLGIERRLVRHNYEAVTDLAAERAARSTRATDWTPAMVLKSVLAHIESGTIDPDCLVVVLSETKPGADSKPCVFVNYAQASRSVSTSLGILQIAAHKMLTEQ